MINKKLSNRPPRVLVVRPVLGEVGQEGNGNDEEEEADKEPHYSAATYLLHAVLVLLLLSCDWVSSVGHLEAVCLGAEKWKRKYYGSYFYCTLLIYTIFVCDLYSSHFRAKIDILYYIARSPY